MSILYSKGPVNYHTMDLTNRVNVGGVANYAPLTFFARFSIGSGIGENGIFSWADNASAGSYVAARTDSSGQLEIWFRGTSGGVLDSPTIGDVRGDGLMHSIAYTWNNRSAAKVNTRVWFDGTTDVQTEVDGGNQTLVDNHYRVGLGLGDYATTPSDYGRVHFFEFAIWRAGLWDDQIDQLHFLRRSALSIEPDKLLCYTDFTQNPPLDLISGTYFALGGTLAGLKATPPEVLSYLPGHQYRSGAILDPVDIAESHILRRRILGAVLAAPTGRIMSSLVGPGGGLAGLGGLAGDHGGLAG